MGNFSRNTFRPERNYSGIRLQTGVPLLDSDWNELEDLRKHELQAALADYLGDGIPAGRSGFKIAHVDSAGAQGTANDFRILAGDGGTPGRCLVRGQLASIAATLRYQEQPLFQNAGLAASWGAPMLPALTTPTAARTDIAYLDIWEREVDSAEDEFLINRDIGVETCVRLKREWVVRVAEGAPIPAPGPGHFHLPLANIARSAGRAEIAAADISDQRRVVFPGVPSQAGAALCVTNEGRVGVRTTQPAYELDVSGTINAPTLRGTLQSPSDLRLKTNIEPIHGALAALDHIHGVRFQWKDDARADYGLIAQEVEAVWPEFVSEDASGYKNLNYPKLVAVLVEAVKELRAELNAERQKRAITQTRPEIET